MSLIELMVSLVILGLIMVMVTRYFRDQQTTIGEQTAMSEVQQNVRASMDMVLRDLRPTGEDPTIKGTFGLVFGSRESIVVTMDVDGDGQLDSNRTAFPDSNEIRGFSFRRDSLRLNILIKANRSDPGNQAGWRWELAATNLDTSGMWISYFDTTNALMNPPNGTAGQLGRVKRVMVDMRGRSERPVGARRQYLRRTLSSDILFRNKV